MNINIKEETKEFQYRLLRIIADRGITPTELARRSGIDKASISNYVNGAYMPKQDKAYRLAKALDCDPGWLMTGDEPLKTRPNREYTAGIPKTNEARIISGGIDRMPPDRREQALKILQIAFSEYADYFKEDNEDDT